MEKSLFKLYLLTIDSCIVKKGSEDLKITHVKIRNYRNLRDIDIGLAETVAIIGENNSGKSNFLKAITLPFLTDDNTHISKKLSWIDINNETKKCYYKKIILNQNKIRNDEITVEQFAEFLPTVSVEVNIQASGAEEYYVKDMSYAIEDGEIQYGIKYEFTPKNFADIFRVVKEVVSQTEINDANLKEVKMNLLPVEYYNYSIKVSDGSNVSYDTLRMFKYEALEAERDDFSKTKNQLGSKFLVDLLKDRLSDQDKLKIEKEYSHFFEALKEISDINDIINWQETSELKGAKKFFSHINILPNMPPMQSILSSVRLGYSEEELSMQGLGHRNLVLLFVLINSLLGKETDIALNVLTIEEPEAHLCINNTRLMVSFLKAFTDKNKTVQLFYSTHSTEFINKMNLKNVVVLHNGKAYSFADELEDEDFAYLAKNPNLDLFKLFFSKKCILFEGISEELLIRSYIDSKETLSDIEVLSFHKGFKKIMNIWKKVNEGSGNKLGIIRDYDNQSNAKKQHDKYNDDKEICVRTTEYYTLEPEIVNTGDNYKILKNKYGDVFGWNDMTDDQLTEAWKNAKATDMFTICKDLASGELEGFQMPKHIQDVIDFLSQESEEVL
ncbi:ATP-dependent nuclease [Coprococcus sp. OM04-5BH]|uniref:ATP-dependent nuclease n=1 Tax=Coprococcus sp. OM04-5BH TaxID=2293093 RepID=UPI001FAAF80E|nr:AAA family ATPase [Coprococcus sp. OM04-5BH]